MKKWLRLVLEDPYDGFFLVVAILFSLAVLAVFFARADAAWKPAGCAPVGSGFTGWRLYQGKYYYYQNGLQVAGWDGEVYRTYDPVTGVWGPPQDPPWKKAGCTVCQPCGCDPCSCASPERQRREQTDSFPRWQTHGVNQEKICDHERCTLNGKAAGDTRLPDDAKRNRLVIIGSEQEQKKVLDDLNQHSLLAPLALDLVVRNYTPDHWHVAKAGFVTNGHPTIYLQAPDGKVLHRSNGYPGPEKLAEAIRRAKPNYDPAKDPDLTKTPSASSVSGLPFYVLGAAALVYYLLRRKA